MKLSYYVEQLSMGNANDNLKLEFYRKCYEMYYKVNRELKKLEKLAEIEGVSVKVIVANAREYEIRLKRKTPDRLAEIYHQQQYIESWQNKPKKVRSTVRSTPINNLFLKLMQVEETDLEQIIQLVEESGLDVMKIKHTVKYRTSDFVNSYFPEQNYFLTDSLRRKLDIFVEYRNQIEVEKQQKEEQQRVQEEQERYKERKFLLEEFVESCYWTKEEYCSSIGCSLDIFLETLEFSKKYDDSLYQRYYEKWKQERNRRYAILMKEVASIVTLIRKGVIGSDQVVRSFDILDYYCLTKLNFQEFMDFCFDLKLDKGTLKVVKIFITKNKQFTVDHYEEIRKIKDSKQEVNCQKDKNGKLIPGTGRVVELEEKEQILNFLRENKIPLNLRTYSIAFRRYLDGTLCYDNRKGHMVRVLKNEKNI